MCSIMQYPQPSCLVSACPSSVCMQCSVCTVFLVSMQCSLCMHPCCRAHYACIHVAGLTMHVAVLTMHVAVLTMHVAVLTMHVAVSSVPMQNVAPPQRGRSMSMQDYDIPLRQRMNSAQLFFSPPISCSPPPSGPDSPSTPSTPDTKAFAQQHTLLSN